MAYVMSRHSGVSYIGSYCLCGTVTDYVAQFFFLTFRTHHVVLQLLFSSLSLSLFIFSFSFALQSMRYCSMPLTAWNSNLVSILTCSVTSPTYFEVLYIYRSILLVENCWRSLFMCSYEPWSRDLSLNWTLLQILQRDGFFSYSPFHVHSMFVYVLISRS